MLPRSRQQMEQVRALLDGTVASKLVDSAEEGQTPAWLPPRVVLAFSQAGLATRSIPFYLGGLGLVIVTLFALLLLTNLLAFLVLVIALPLSAALYVNKLRLQRSRSFESDYTAFLLSLASAVKTGTDPLVAFTNTQEMFDANTVIHQEIKGFTEEIERGVPESKAILRFGRSIMHPDLKLFRTAFILARREGSSLAACLQRLVRVTRQRQSFRRKTRSAVAMQRLSAFGIAACTLVIAVIQFTTNPDAMLNALDDPSGQKILASGVLLIVGGIVWMLQMTKARV